MSDSDENSENEVEVSKSKKQKTSHRDAEQEDDDELDEDDDEYDEEEEEDDEDYDKGRKGRKKKKKPANGYILDEAEVDDDDEEDEEWEDGVEAAIIENDRHNYRNEPEGGPSARDIEGHRRLAQMLHTEKEDEIEAYYRSRYAETSARDRALADSQTSEDIAKQSLLPNVKDPNLWMVKCKIGEERATCLQLMRKFIAFQNSSEPLQIKSALTVEGVKGYIYVEAYKQTHVKQAIENISNLRMGMNNQQMVPIREMTDVLKVVKTTARLKNKQWVRVKRGLYKDDLAQVEWVDHAQNAVSLRLIPRIDYNHIKETKRGNASAKTGLAKARGSRPAQKLFEPDLIRECGADYGRDGDMYLFHGNRYTMRGFLIKTFPLNAITVEGVKPSLNELEKFDDLIEGVDLSKVAAEVSETEENQDATRFTHGDYVVVCEGELINLKGKVIRVEGKKVVIQPDHEDLKDPIEFPARELKKFFRTGDHVRVLRGRYEGDTGLVVRVEDNLIVLFSDLTMHEMKVLPEDVQVSSERASGIDSWGQFQFGDLVEIDQQTVGVIVRIEKDNFHVLNMHGKLLQMKPGAILRKKDSRRAVALDSEHNQIQVKDSVKVTDGIHNGKQGEVKHIFRGVLFLHSKLVAENGGIFVCKARSTVLAGASQTTSSSTTNNNQYSFAPQSPRVAASPVHPSSGSIQGGASERSTPKSGGGRTPSQNQPAVHSPMGFANRNRGRRDNTMIGKTVRIIQGPYKGYIGVVKDCTDATARVELHANCTTISVDRNRLTEINSDGRPTARGPAPFRNDDTVRRTPADSYPRRNPSNFARPDEPSSHFEAGNKTPRYEDPTKTPMYNDGSRTPAYGMGSRTPAYGSRTPGYGGRTPSYMRTPAHESAWDAEREEEGERWDDRRSPRPTKDEEEEPEERDEYEDLAPPPSNYGVPPTPGGYQEDMDSGGVNPRTPGFQAPESPAVNFAPQTPGGMYGGDTFSAPSPYSPAPSRYGASGVGSSSYNSYIQSPGMGYTPGGAAPSPYNPQTPGYESGLYNPPETPGGGVDLNHTDWVTTDIQVRIKRHDDRSLLNLIGYVRSESGAMCSIFLPEKDKVITILVSQVEPITPSRGDLVKVILGDERDICGKMLSVDGREAVFKPENSDQMKMVPWHYLCKMAPTVRI
ncbi:transcription elongation factor SPT5-like [Paramacrobiotus metropolitanus]|uniref:transcription elongation factor SPT5-like n=1 Tax=Paramacrobiotus metropolitanus TaxID=2943436 RepID=UPI00244629E5|nr:transcription elongation factor SPT5-like [Paramacrobiotus metropolitanus]